VVSSEISDLCEISDLLLFLRYFASQSKRMKFGNYFFMCIVLITTFWLDVKISYSTGITLTIENFSDVVVDLNYFSFSHPNQTLTRHTY